MLFSSFVGHSRRKEGLRKMAGRNFTHSLFIYNAAPRTSILSTINTVGTQKSQKKLSWCQARPFTKLESTGQHMKDRFYRKDFGYSCKHGWKTWFKINTFQQSQQTKNCSDRNLFGDCWYCNKTKSSQLILLQVRVFLEKNLRDAHLNEQRTTFQFDTYIWFVVSEKCGHRHQQPYCMTVFQWSYGQP